MTQPVSSKKSQYAGLGWMMVIIAVVLAAPVLYFAINLALGNADLFAVNGYK